MKCGLSCKISDLLLESHYNDETRVNCVVLILLMNIRGFRKSSFGSLTGRLVVSLWPVIEDICPLVISFCHILLLLTDQKDTSRWDPLPHCPISLKTSLLNRSFQCILTQWGLILRCYSRKKHSFSGCKVPG